MNATGSLPLTTFLIAVLAVWRVTHLLWGEDGPFDIFVRLRAIAGAGFFARLLDCFYCLSLWVSAPPAWMLAATWTGRLLVWLALSGGAILLERVTARQPPAPPALWREEPLEKEDRKETLNSCPVVESSVPRFVNKP